ncbi:MAG: carbon-nitrogen hydrolase family protein [Firmicutes bacterium]|jgi:predicted amidohydrolase|nr:carbon-nitrogen hydrolase family protein [Bacillota bacterium]MDH7496483.1 carbon-nitrogen hydrolase family protein [Bacillota bacterium]
MKSKLTVSCVQLSAFPLERAEEGLAHALGMVDKAAMAAPDLVVLPECAYPAYYLADWASRRSSLRPASEVLGLFAEKARRYGCYIAVGIAEEPPGENKEAYNSGFLLDPEGRVAGSARKQFLWHFDARWFTPGVMGDAVQLPWGRVGMFICADGRLPEIPRALALKGARLFIDLTNLVAASKDETRLTSAQVEYMLKARAIENQAWIVMANKVGTEADTIVYCGRSLVVSPQGDVVAQGSAHIPEVVTAEIPLPLDCSGAVDGVFEPLAARRPDTYGDLVRPFEELTVSSTIEESVVPGEKSPVVAAFQLDMDESTDLLAPKIERRLRDLAVQGVELVILPEPFPRERPIEENEALLRLVSRASAHTGLAVVFTGDEIDGTARYRTAFFVEKGAVTARYRKVHLDASEKGICSPGSGPYPVVCGERGNFGIMLGYEGLLPEVARILALRGADVILWPCRFAGDRYEWFARTRAAENRVFVVAANAVGRHGIGASLIASPQGAVLAQAFAGREQAVSATLVTAEARCKSIVPGTDAILGRQPMSYRLLVESARS